MGNKQSEPRISQLTACSVSRPRCTQRDGERERERLAGIPQGFHLGADGHLRVRTPPNAPGKGRLNNLLSSHRLKNSSYSHQPEENKIHDTKDIRKTITQAVGIFSLTFKGYSDLPSLSLKGTLRRVKLFPDNCNPEESSRIFKSEQ